VSPLQAKIFFGNNPIFLIEKNLRLFYSSIVENYFEEKLLNWNKLESICTDGAPAMTGKLNGFAAKVHTKAPHVKMRHCMIHKEALASKGLPADFEAVFGIVVKIINFIKSRAKNSRLFKQICEESDTTFTTLLMHTAVRWLSRGNSSLRAFQARKEIVKFSEKFQFAPKDRMKGKKALFEIFATESFQQKLAYLTDIFQKLNACNLSLQGIIEIIFKHE
jgi:hypothetical protein